MMPSDDLKVGYQQYAYLMQELWKLSNDVLETMLIYELAPRKELTNYDECQSNNIIQQVSFRGSILYLLLYS